MITPSSPPSLWDAKPWWCQPWSIILTGIVIPTVVWWFTHWLWLVVPAVVVILGWWILFLYLAPKAYRQMGASLHANAIDTQQVD